MGWIVEHTFSFAAWGSPLKEPLSLLKAWGAFVPRGFSAETGTLFFWDTLAESVVKSDLYSSSMLMFPRLSIVGSEKKKTCPAGSNTTLLTLLDRLAKSFEFTFTNPLNLLTKRTNEIYYRKYLEFWHRICHWRCQWSSRCQVQK